MYTVTISERGKPPVKLDFDKPEITIGRVRGNDIVLQKNNVSKRHAKLVVKDGQFIIIDQKSTNGTIVNARKITAPQVVREDDKICIGDFILTLRHEDRPRVGSGAAMLASRPSPRPVGPPPGPPPRAHPSSPPSAPQPPAPISGVGMGPPPGVPTKRPEPYRPSGAQAQAEVPPPSGPYPQPSSPLPGQPPSATTLRPGGPPQALAELGEQFRAEGVRSSAEVSRPPSPEPPSAVPRSTLAGFGQVPSARAEAPMAPRPEPARPPSGAERLPRPSDSARRPAPRPVEAPAAAPEPTPAAKAPVAAAVAPPPPAVAVPARVSRTPLAKGVAVGEPSTAFDRAQKQAFDRLVEHQGLDDLPRAYPPSSATLAERERSVDRLLDQMASDGLIDGLDRQELVRILAFELAGLGPLEIYLDDSDVRAIFVNGSEHIYLRGESGGQRAARHFSEARALQLAAERLIRLSEKVDSHVYAARFADGTRVELVVPPAAEEPLITVRKRPESYRSLEQLVEAGVLSQEMATFARHAVEARRSVLVAGPVNSGKTELLNALGSTIDDGTRIVVVEETERLRLPQQSLVSLGWANLGDAAGRVMSYALRLQPERLIVDDIGPAIAYDWILGTAFSALGSIAAVGATGDRDALTRLESMALSRAPMLSLRGVREQIARAVNIVMVLAKTPGGQNRVTQVVEVQGLELETVRLQDVFFYQRGGDGASFQATGHIPAFYEELRRSGIDSDLSIFRS